mgnify:CR=1 FL=1
MVNMTHPLILKSLYRMWDHKVCVEDHEIPVRIFAPHKEDKSYQFNAGQNCTRYGGYGRK